VHICTRRDKHIINISQIRCTFIGRIHIEEGTSDMVEKNLEL